MAEYNDVTGGPQEDTRPVVEMDFIILVKGEHRYIFMYEVGREEEVQNKLMDYAESKDYDLDWSDVLCVIKEMQHAGMADTPDSGGMGNGQYITDLEGHTGKPNAAGEYPVDFPDEPEDYPADSDLSDN